MVIGLVGAWRFMNQQRAPQLPNGGEAPNELVETFQNELSRRALARGPHPVEGFDASMLLATFPGFQESDFDGVPTGGGPEEGMHTYRNDELQWERTGNAPATSAAQSITSIGYGVLLGNVADRLEMSAATRAHIMAIINAIDIPEDIRDHIQAKSDLIMVAHPRPLATVTSPLTVYGQARGQWFFEADFQLTLTDWDGKIIAQSYASAVLDPNNPDSTWMTEEFVPFEGTITFENPAFPGTDAEHFSHRGTLIFQKANPSDLPENDDALEIPVRFE